MTLLQIPAPPAPSHLPDPNLIAPLVQEAVVILLALIAGTIIAVKVLGPLARAFARRLDGKSADPDLRGDVEHLRQQVAELDDLRARVGELDERVEFAERLLAQGRERDLLQSGGPGA
jgi:hypothetical protein